jgi:prefoldin subunit 5
MADCGSLESLMTSLTNEVATLKTKVANLESEKNQYATKAQLESKASFLEGSIKGIKGELIGLIKDIAVGIVREIIEQIFNNKLEPRIRVLEIKVAGLEFVSDSHGRVIRSLKQQIARLESAISELKNTVGQILMDIKNIYNILGDYRRRIESLENIIGQILTDILNIYDILKRLKFKKGEKGDKGDKGNKGEKGADGRNGRDGSNGEKGADGRNGRDGSNGEKGADGRNGRDGSNGEKGADGRNGQDAKVEFVTIKVKVFTGCKDDGTPEFENQDVRVLKGLEDERAKEFNELAALRAESCKKPPEQECSIPLHIGELYEHLPISHQLVLEFQTVKRDGKDKKSRWHMSIPEPKPCEDYDWCRDFEPLKRTLGTVSARIQWEDHSMKTAAYFSNEGDAESFMENKILKLSTIKPVRNPEGKAIRISKFGSPKRRPRERPIQCNRAIWIKMGTNGEVEETRIFLPPPKGC